ncbi:MAG TPA: hypothetical protein VLD67_16255 [Vicinamibacterales bacterium]|nr:hypothetical protein [Vicinamibacterales bacterium]
MVTHLSEEDLVLHYYGESAGSEQTRTSDHLGACAECREQFRRLQRVLAAVNESTFAGLEPPAHFERTVWARLEPALRPQRPDRLSWLALSPPRLAWAAGIILLVGAAFYAGRLMPRPADEAPAQAANAAEVRERILFIDLDDHLERSQMVLVELVSADADADVADGRARAAQLVAANRLYRQTATTTGNTSVAELLDELERVLVELAAQSDAPSGRELDAMRQRIDAQGLLFKVRVVSSELRERQRSTVQQQAGGRRSSL